MEASRGDNATEDEPAEREVSLEHQKRQVLLEDASKKWSPGIGGKRWQNRFAYAVERSRIRDAAQQGA